ncbi:hypothetical protein AB0I85_04185 [Micromonospora echinofusca]|uniref:hypothetical protein n=1 Tax=Micromonospora echinofusca TaxID=47858 RepID=UPI000CC55F34|nr:hypothetical protein [Micromonospora sp. MSM11]MCL7461003.1 hypothetical protein [Micromonospora sp. MSM11]
MLVSTAAGVVGAVAGVMQWLTSAGAWAVVAVGLAGLVAACWALAWLWVQRRSVLATVVVLFLVILSAVTGAATDRIVGRAPAAGDRAAVAATPTPDGRPTSAVPTSPTPAPTHPATPTGRPTDPTDTPDPSTTASPTPAGTKPPSRTQDDVTLSVYYFLDLDSAATNWNVQSGYGLGRAGDLLLGPAGVETPGDVVVIAGKPSQSACEMSVTRQRGIGGGQIRAGQSFCVQTTEKRWAWLTIKRYEPERTLTFDVIVW